MQALFICRMYDRFIFSNNSPFLSRARITSRSINEDVQCTQLFGLALFYFASSYSDLRRQKSSLKSESSFSMAARKLPATLKFEAFARQTGLELAGKHTKKCSPLPAVVGRHWAKTARFIKTLRTAE